MSQQAPDNTDTVKGAILDHINKSSNLVPVGRGDLADGTGRGEQIISV